MSNVKVVRTNEWFLIILIKKNECVTKMLTHLSGQHLIQQHSKGPPVHRLPVGLVGNNLEWKTQNIWIREVLERDVVLGGTQSSRTDGNRLNTTSSAVQSYLREAVLMISTAGAIVLPKPAFYLPKNSR